MKRLPTILLWQLSALGALSYMACYTVKNSIPGHIKTIAIPVLRNESLQGGVEDEATRRIIQRFQERNVLAIAEPATANSLLEGVIKNYENKVYRFDDKEQASEYILIITVNVIVQDRVKNKELWSEEGIRATATYEVVGPRIRTESEARTEAIDQLADIILSRTLEGW
ncbi:MAG: LPS assembly lipoprotein LptE [Candidatus Eisenbacteria bacterium]|nr:LPS assembly lipoprotein LptE [Candidatus Eisenbacteria bacterium]